MAASQNSRVETLLVICAQVAVGGPALALGGTLAVAPGQVGAAPTISAEFLQKGYEWSVCVENAARRLEPSGESPDDVAQAAMEDCKMAEIATFNTRPFEEIPLDQYSKEALRKDMMKKAITAVIEARADRNSRR
jgi:hypothetical protein